MINTATEPPIHTENPFLQNLSNRRREIMVLADLLQDPLSLPSRRQPDLIIRIEKAFVQALRHRRGRITVVPALPLNPPSLPSRRKSLSMRRQSLTAQSSPRRIKTVVKLRLGISKANIRSHRQLLERGPKLCHLRPLILSNILTGERIIIIIFTCLLRRADPRETTGRAKQSEEVRFPGGTVAG